jgi:hypothetical protein
MFPPLRLVLGSQTWLGWLGLFQQVDEQMGFAPPMLKHIDTKYSNVLTRIIIFIRCPNDSDSFG